MKHSLYLKIIFYIILSLTISGCGDNNCYCVETITRFQPYRVTVEEYWTSGCDYPFTSVQTYWWGNTLTDCR
jgi:hypothetical protein